MARITIPVGDLSPVTPKSLWDEARDRRSHHDAGRLTCDAIVLLAQHGFVPVGWIPGGLPAAWQATLAREGIPFGERIVLRLNDCAEGQSRDERDLWMHFPWGSVRQIAGRGAAKDLASVLNPDAGWCALVVQAVREKIAHGAVTADTAKAVKARLALDGVVVGLKEDGTRAGTHLHVTTQVEPQPGSPVYVMDRLVERQAAGAAVPPYWEIRLTENNGQIRMEVIDFLTAMQAGMRAGHRTTRRNAAGTFPLAVRRDTDKKVNGGKSGIAWVANVNTPAMANDPEVARAWARGTPGEGVNPMPYLQNGTLIPR
jgi:hypothetical protein